jgi:hypothetical protein
MIGLRQNSRIEDVKEGGYTPRYSAAHFFAANAIPNGPEFRVVAAVSPVRLEGRLTPPHFGARTPRRCAFPGDRYSRPRNPATRR